MREIVFGTFTEELYATLVWSRLANLSLMEAGSPPEDFSDIDFDDIPEDAFDPALSPGALEAQDKESSQADPLAMVVDKEVNPFNQVVDTVAQVVAVQPPTKSWMTSQMKSLTRHFRQGP